MRKKSVSTGQNKNNSRGRRAKLLGMLLACAMITGTFASGVSAKGISWDEFFGTYSEEGEEAPYQSYEWAEDSDQPATEQKETSKSKKKKNKKEGKQTEKQTEKADTKEPNNEKVHVEEDGEYTSKDEVAAYLNEYGHLPGNYITKNEARELGWNSSKGNLDKVAPGKSIGGDRFGNNEGLLPNSKGRKYFECDIDYKGGRRNAKRIIYSNDGLIFYTEDHYESFEQLYPAED